MQDVAADVFAAEEKRILDALDVERFNRESVYNHPGFRPVRAEHSHVPLKVEGRLPEDLEGVYLRNGTNIQFDRVTTRSHVFNGEGMLHQVQVAGGRATYSNTYVRTPRYEYEKQVGREVFPNFGDMSSSGMAGLERLKLIAKKQAAGLIPKWSGLEANPASTSIQYHHGELYCLQGSGWPFVLKAGMDQGRLILDGSGRLENWGGALPTPFSAHPKIDPVSGDFYSVALDTRNRALTLTQIHEGRLVNHVKIHDFEPGRDVTGTIHDYFLTERYIVIADISLRFSEANVAGPAQSFWRFDASHKLRWGVLPRDFKPGDKVRWFETAAPGMVWHIVNGWEEAGPEGGVRIVLFAPVFPEYPSNLPIHTPEEPPAHLTRWVLDLGSGRVIEEKRLLEHGYERPSLNLDWVAKKNRYAYLIDEAADGYMGKGVLKYDLLEEKELGYFSYGNYYGGEALFVPRANSIAEDDGYLLELLMSAEDAQFLVLDARTLEEVARLKMPARVPFGVHACWLDRRKLGVMEGRSIR